MTVRVLIVDDHAVVRTGLRLLLEKQDDMAAVGEAGSVEEAVAEAQALKPDLVLLDLTMPGTPGLQALPALLGDDPELKVLILSMEDDPRYVREAFAAGARGYLLKEAVANEVVGAIREVASGGRYVAPGARRAADRHRALGRCAAGRPAFRARAGGTEAPRARPHEPRDREVALHLGEDGRGSSRAHHEEAPSRKPRRARPLRDRARHASGLRAGSGSSAKPFTTVPQGDTLRP
jgi:DNA-binding NarL/FixJ family response regulator